MKNHTHTGLRVALLIMIVLVAGCARRQDERSSAGAIWTPAPVTGSMQLATPGAAIIATREPAPVEPASTEPPATPAVVATRDPNAVVITEQDVLKAVQSGAAQQDGAELLGVSVDFAGGKMRLTADRATYKFVSVDNLVVVGRLVAVDGRLQMETESVSPRGIVTAFIPTIANQALSSYTSRWYIEDVQTLDDRLELRVRQ